MRLGIGRWLLRILTCATTLAAILLAGIGTLAYIPGERFEWHSNSSNPSIRILNFGPGTWVLSLDSDLSDKPLQFFHAVVQVNTHWRAIEVDWMAPTKANSNKYLDYRVGWWHLTASSSGKIGRNYSRVDMRFPAWACCAFSLILLLPLTPSVARRIRRYRRRRLGLCVKCGYNLTGNVSGRCPECGREIDPSRGD